MNTSFKIGDRVLIIRSIFKDEVGESAIIINYDKAQQYRRYLCSFESYSREDDVGYNRWFSADNLKLRPPEYIEKWQTNLK